MEEPVRRTTGIRDVTFGRNVVIFEPVNLYECLLEDEVRIGPFVEIQSGVRVGARTKVQSHAFLCEGVEIGADCFVSHGVMFVNDLFRSGRPAGGDRALWGRTTVAARVSIGSGAVILPVSICSDVVIGAGAVVTKDINLPGVYAGNPARLLRRLAADGDKR